MLAFAPTFFVQPALAETRAEYDAIVAAAEAKLSAAQDALAKAEEAYNSAIKKGQDLVAQIDLAKQDLQTAQLNYEQDLMLDPNWVRPTKDIQVSEQVPRIIQVPHTETITETVLVPRTITTVIPGGLTAKVYNMAGYNNAPPLPTEDRLVSTQTVPNINYQWGSGYILNTYLSEDTIVKFTGTINIPTSGTYGFYAPGDDGIQVLIDGTRIINDWRDKGGGGSYYSGYFDAGSHQITLWYYENGGGANVWLYWAQPGSGYEIVPPSAFGEVTQITTVFDEVITVREVTTFTDETVYDTVWHTETVLDTDAIQPEIQNPDLLLVVNEKQSTLDTLNSDKTENSSIIELASLDVTNKQEELVVAQSELQAIPPFTEPAPTPEKTTEPAQVTEVPVSKPIPEPDQTATPEPSQPELPVNVETVDPQSLTPTQVEELKTVANEILATAEQGSPEYEQALTALFVAAQADDIVVNEELAAVPVLGATVVALTDAVNFLGNAGADMSPKVREESKKVVVTAVVAVGAAVNAATGAALTAAAPSAAASASAGGSGGTSSRRRND